MDLSKRSARREKREGGEPILGIDDHLASQDEDLSDDGASDTLGEGSNELDLMAEGNALSNALYVSLGIPVWTTMIGTRLLMDRLSKNPSEDEEDEDDDEDIEQDSYRRF